MTWHAKALQTSYVTRARHRLQRPGRGRAPRSRTRTASWFFLDAVDMMAPADTRVIVVLRRLDHRRHRLDHERRRPLAERAVAASARRGLSRARCSTPGSAATRWPGRRTIRRRSRFPGGPSAGARIERDVLSLSGVTADDLARRHQRLQQERQCQRRDRADAHEGGRLAHARTPARHQGVRRHRGRPRSVRPARRTAFPSRTRSARR